jgi:hypothetical protein
MTDDGPPEFDDARAAALIGRTILFGITYRDPDGDRLVQMHGTIVDLDRAGVVIGLAGQRSGLFTLPPDLDAIQAAAPGLYHLRSTGEDVENPDLLATWTVESPTLTETDPAAR